ncbi:MAG: hypothetical protein SWH61_04580 [Thermodesulfobacteriota bacterium]|nr:hypothetical protein [Thermodesulfobacteriota bacterium]
MNENIYAPPKSNLIEEKQTETELATRWQRFLASTVDGLIMMVVILPVMCFTG